MTLNRRHTSLCNIYSDRRPTSRSFRHSRKFQNFCETLQDFFMVSEYWKSCCMESTQNLRVESQTILFITNLAAGRVTCSHRSLKNCGCMLSLWASTASCHTVKDIPELVSDSLLYWLWIGSDMKRTARNCAMPRMNLIRLEYKLC